MGATSCCSCSGDCDTTAGGAGGCCAASGGHSVPRTIQPDSRSAIESLNLISILLGGARTYRRVPTPVKAAVTGSVPCIGTEPRNVSEWPLSFLVVVRRTMIIRRECATDATPTNAAQVMLGTELRSAVALSSVSRVVCFAANCDRRAIVQHNQSRRSSDIRVGRLSPKAAMSCCRF